MNVAPTPLHEREKGKRYTGPNFPAVKDAETDENPVQTAEIGDEYAVKYKKIIMPCRLTVDIVPHCRRSFGSLQ